MSKASYPYTYMVAVEDPRYPKMKKRPFVKTKDPRERVRIMAALIGAGIEAKAWRA